MSYDNLFNGGQLIALGNPVRIDNHTQWEVNVEDIKADRNIWNPTVDKKFPLGAVAKSRDRRRWSYCENGSVALVKALINQQAAGVANLQNEVQTDGVAFTVGDKIITVTTTTVVQESIAR